MEIYAIKLSTQIEQEKFDKLLSMLEEEKQNRIKRYIKWADRQRSLIGDILVRIAVVKKLGLKNSDIKYEKNKYGKPSIIGVENFHFNISHSGDWIVCAIDDKRVGVDVEQINPIDLEIANRFFSKEEHEDLLNKPQDERLLYFFDLWTLKESFIKICGKGLSIPLDSFAIRKENNYISVNSKLDKNQYYFHQYNVDSGYKFSACSSIDDFPEEIIIKDFDKVYELAIILLNK